MLCKNCGKEIDDNSTICKFCGTQIENNNITHSNRLHTQKINKLNITHCLYLCAMIIIIITIFIANKNYRSTQNNKLEIEEVTDMTTIEAKSEEATNIITIESKSEEATDTQSIDDLFKTVEKKLYFDMNIDTFIQNYNSYFYNLNQYDLTINKDVSKKDNNGKMTFYLNDNITLNITYDSSYGNKINSVEFTSKYKSSSTTLEALKCVIYTIISSVSSKEAINSTTEFIDKISNNNNNDIGTLINDYIYDISYSSDDNIKVYISTKHFYEEIKVNNGSSCYFDISMKDFINNYNEYLEKNNELELYKITPENLYNYNDYNLIDSTHISFTNDYLDITINYNQYYEKGIEAIKLKIHLFGDEEKKEQVLKTIEKDIEAILNAIVYSLNKDNTNSDYNSFANDLITNITYSENLYSIDKYFENYKYYINKRSDVSSEYFSIDINVNITKENKYPTNNFGIKIYDFIRNYNRQVDSYINSDDYRGEAQAYFYKSRILIGDNKINFDNDDTITCQILDDYENDMYTSIQITYNPNSNEIKAVKFNFKNMADYGDSDEFNRAINSILSGLHSNMDSYSDILLDIINDSTERTIDICLGKYRYLGSYINGSCELSIYNINQTKPIEIPFDISIDEFFNNYKNFTGKNNYTDLSINYYGDSYGYYEYYITDNLKEVMSSTENYSHIGIEYYNDSNKLNKIKYTFQYYNENDLKALLMTIMYSINSHIPTDNIKKDANDLTNTILNSDTMNINKTYGNYNYDIICTKNIIFIKISKIQ